MHLQTIMSTQCVESFSSLTQMTKRGLQGISFKLQQMWHYMVQLPLHNHSNRLHLNGKHAYPKHTHLKQIVLKTLKLCK